MITGNLILLLNLTVHGHDHLPHQRAKGLLAILHGEYFSFGNDQSTSGAYHLTSGDELFCIGWSKQIHFIFDGQYRGTGWHDCHGRVADSRIGNCADHTAMHKAVLLLDAFPVREVDFGAAVLDNGQRGS